MGAACVITPYDLPVPVPNFAQHQFWQTSDVAMMTYALSVAKQGAKLGEVPVGAVLVHQGKILATGFNCPILSSDPTAHAEVVAIRKACQKLHNYRLPQGTTLYVTLEPCTLCLGAMIHARLSRVVFGAYEPKAGVILSQETFAQKSYFNHHLDAQGGLLANECGQLLSAFFRQRRQQKRAQRYTQKDSKHQTPNFHHHF